MPDNQNQNKPAASADKKPESSHSGPRERFSRERDSESGGGSRPYRGGNKSHFRKKVCRFCSQNFKIDYKNAESLRRFITERGKILPRRITGTCAKHQRYLSEEVKRARVIAILPYVKK